MESTEKLYRCSKCGTFSKQKTNHYGDTYSWGRFNCCPNCPPHAKYPEYGGATIWECCVLPIEEMTLAKIVERKKFYFGKKIVQLIEDNLGWVLWVDGKEHRKYTTRVGVAKDIRRDIMDLYPIYSKTIAN